MVLGKFCAVFVKVGWQFFNRIFRKMIIRRLRQESLVLILSVYKSAQQFLFNGINPTPFISIMMLKCRLHCQTVKMSLMFFNYFSHSLIISIPDPHSPISNSLICSSTTLTEVFQLNSEFHFLGICSA